jgi:hypothetical protein
MIAFGDKIERDRPRPFLQQRADVAVQLVDDRIAPIERVRPRILTGHGPAHIVGDVVEKGRAAAVRGVVIDLLNELLVGGGAHLGFSK